MTKRIVQPFHVMYVALGDASTVNRSICSQSLRVVLMQHVSTTLPEMLRLLLQLNLVLDKQSVV